MEREAVQAGGRAITFEQIEHQLAGAQNKPRAAIGPDILLQLPFYESVAGWERRLIENALQITVGNKAEAARPLGIHRGLLYEKLQQFGMD